MGVIYKFKIFLFIFFLISFNLISLENGTVIFTNKKGKKISLKVEFAKSEPDKIKGLMFRKTLSLNQGMLFFYKKESILYFWMKNTYIPLSIAFINKKGRIVHIADMQPLNQSLVSSKKPSLYAIEVNKGWFKKNKILPGNLMEIKK